MKTDQKIECSIVLVDLSGFTQLLYQSSTSEKTMELVLKSIETLFRKSGEATKRTKHVQIINTTGDGFIAIARGTTPSRTAVDFAKLVQKQFEKYVKQTISSVPFRQRVDLRIALHHGTIYKIEIPFKDKTFPLYIGDDLNLLARVINSQTSRRFTFAVTKSFYKRLMLTRKTPIPDEVILDRNRYPEEIEVFRIPDEIPKYKTKKAKPKTQTTS